MKNLFVCFLILLTISSSVQIESNDFVVKGKIKGAAKDTRVVLSLAPLSGKVIKLDSINVAADGSFQFKGIEKDRGTVFSLSAPGLKNVFLLIEGGETLVVESDLSTGNSVVTGSENMKYYAQINSIEQEYETKLVQWREDHRIADENKDTKKINEIQRAFDEGEFHRTEQIRKLLPEMGTSFAAVYVASKYLVPDVDYLALKKLASKLEELKPIPLMAKNFISRLNEIKGLKIGDEAPDIILNDPYGKETKLSSLRGKYVLIDFWASWCGPCRQENPHVVKMYDKYKDKGFEIYGVSKDKNKNAWIAAIKKDNLSWVHGSDLKADQSVVFKQYDVTGIPATFLVDPNGLIIAKNLRGPDLERRIGELLDK